MQLHHQAFIIDTKCSRPAATGALQLASNWPAQPWPPVSRQKAAGTLVDWVQRPRVALCSARSRKRCTMRSGRGAEREWEKQPQTVLHKSKSKSPPAPPKDTSCTQLQSVIVSCTQLQLLQSRALFQNSQPNSSTFMSSQAQAWLLFCLTLESFPMGSSRRTCSGTSGLESGKGREKFALSGGAQWIVKVASSPVWQMRKRCGKKLRNYGTK